MTRPKKKQNYITFLYETLQLRQPLHAAVTLDDLKKQIKKQRA